MEEGLSRVIHKLEKLGHNVDEVLLNVSEILFQINDLNTEILGQELESIRTVYERRAHAFATLATAFGCSFFYAIRKLFEAKFRKHGKELENYGYNLRDLPRQAIYIEIKTTTR